MEQRARQKIGRAGQNVWCQIKLESAQQGFSWSERQAYSIKISQSSRPQSQAVRMDLGGRPDSQEMLS